MRQGLPIALLRDRGLRWPDVTATSVRRRRSSRPSCVISWTASSHRGRAPHDLHHHPHCERAKGGRPQQAPVVDAMWTRTARPDRCGAGACRRRSAISTQHHGKAASGPDLTPATPADRGPSVPETMVAHAPRNDMRATTTPGTHTALHAPWLRPPRRPPHGPGGNHANLPDSGPQRERVATLIIVETTRNCGAGD